MLTLSKSNELSEDLVDEMFMRRALELADTPQVSVLPNPRVGAVIVIDGKIVGEGFHQGPGHPHAEVVAIKAAERSGIKSFEHATLYSTLEPCSHLKKRTPPCAPLVASKNFERVVVGHSDPNPQVSGRGLKYLKAAKINIKESCLEKAAEAINQAFIKNQKLNLPYVTLKLALTFDGKLADDHGKSQWITGELARDYVHQLRARADAVAVGSGTIDRDNPRLNARAATKIFKKKIVIFGKPEKKISELKATKANGAENIFRCSSKKSLKKNLKEIYTESGIRHLFVEGGSELASAFLKENLVDELILIYGRGFVGGRGTYTLLSGKKRKLENSIPFLPTETRLLGNDVVLRGLKNVYRTH